MKYLEKNAWFIVIMLATILMMLFGCSNTSYTNKPYVIAQVRGDSQTKMCYYSNDNEMWYIYDTCYKFHVGEVIKLNAVKW